MSRTARTTGYAPRNALNADRLKAGIIARSEARGDAAPVRAWLLNHFYRHLVANAKLGRLMGVESDNVLLCEDGDVLELTDTSLAHSTRVPAGYLYVDGIVGDVGQGVLRDRRVLAEEGVVVVVVPSHTRSEVSLGGESSVCPFLHTVTFLHTRLLVAVRSFTRYDVPSTHTARSPHSRSVVAVLCLLMYWVKRSHLVCLAPNGHTVMFMKLGPFSQINAGVVSTTRTTRCTVRPGLFVQSFTS